VHARSRSSTVVGALIVAHRPGNGIGGLFSAVALLAATGGLAQEYASYAYVTRPGALPGAIAAGWYAAWAWYPTLALAVVFTCSCSRPVGWSRHGGGPPPGWPGPPLWRSRRWPPSSPHWRWSTTAWSPTPSGSPRWETPSRARSARPCST
jgi:hypothetical protein